MASSKLLSGASIAGLVGVGLFGLPALAAAQTAAPAEPRGAVEAAETDIVILGTKRSAGELAQDAPVAVTAFGADQLDALNFQTLQTLSYTMPNTALEDIGTAPGVANFTIRGIGTNSSIPSVDPTVGVFVDGVYMGLQAGGVFDTFDLEGVEVLRGPQGVLFGRNVTGGAILVRTRAPTDYFDVRGGVSLETGNNWAFDGTMSGPLIENVLSGKLGWLHNDDDGWFKNLASNSQFGKTKNDVFRTALRLTPTEDLDVTLRLQQTNYRGSGPASQNHANYSRDSFDFAVDNVGFTNSDARSVTLEGNWRVGFGDGTITNIFGWADFDSATNGDIDSTANPVFHSRSVTAQDQVSNELRYNGTFGAVELTVGGYYFQQDLLYIEERSGLAFVPAGGTLVGGGQGDFSTQGLFIAGDWHLNDQITLNAGVRYTEESKKARTSRLRNAVSPLDGATVVAGEGVVGGSIDNRTLAYSDSPFDLSWDDVSPRIGVQWEPDADTQLYASASRGFRSGGVNFRTTTLGTALASGAPVAYDAEEQTAFEVGIKKDFLDRRARLNLALFHSKVDKLQRETNIPDPAGVQQNIVNAGDAVFQGAELEGRFSILDNLLVSVQAGYTDASYDTVTADLDGDTIAGAAGDQDQKIPRVSPWTYGASLLHDLQLGSLGLLSSRVAYNHRDESFYNDANTGRLNEADIIDLNFTFKPEAFANLQISLYGNNVTDEATFGGDTVLPDVAAFGGDGAGPKPAPTFSPLNKGRVWGAEVRARF